MRVLLDGVPMRIDGSFNSLRAYDLYLNGGYLAAGVVVTIALYAAIVLPIHAETARIHSEAAACKDLIQTTSQITVERQRLERQLADKQQILANLQRRIPPAPHEAEFLAQVCELAHRVGVEVTDYHPGAVQQRETYQELEVKFSGRGDYEAVCRFLHQTEEIPRLCRLVHFDLNAGEGDKPLTCDFTYHIYFIPSADAGTLKKETSS